MKILASQDSIISGIGLLRRALDKSWERFPLNQNLVGVLALAYQAHREIAELGKKNLEELAEIDRAYSNSRGEVRFIDPCTALPCFVNDVSPLAKDTYRHQVECALRILVTYQRLCELQTKLKEYRILKSLDTIL